MDLYFLSNSIWPCLKITSDLNQQNKTPEKTWLIGERKDAQKLIQKELVERVC